MQLLVDNELKYGNLLLVDSAHLIARYNRALNVICGKKTELEIFHIDGSGYSPEVAKELDDKEYMNPHGVNKKIIILSLEQEGLPVLDSYFSTTRDLIRRFIQDNKSELFALTSRDVVYGELENSTFKIESFTDLLCIKRIIFEINTVGDSIKKGKQLTSLIKSFMVNDNMWHDEKTVEEIIGLSSVVGDIRRHQVTPSHTEYKQINFYSRHYGGVYVFNHDNGDYTVIAHEEQYRKEAETCHLNVKFIHIDDKKEVIAFLKKNNIVEMYSDRYLRKNIDLMREKINFIAIDHMSQTHTDADLTDISDDEIKKYIYDHYDELPKEFRVLSKAVKLIDNGYSVDLESGSDDIFFYFARSSDHDLKDLVNQLIAYYTPLDFLNVFISNKRAFYELYDEWSNSKKSFVVNYLVREYQQDKHRIKGKFFG